VEARAKKDRRTIGLLKERRQIRRRRYDAGARNLAAHVQRDLCPKSAIRNLLRNGVAQPTHPSADDLLELDVTRSPQQGRDFVKSLIERLQNPNFELGLLDDVDTWGLDYTFYKVNAEHAAFLEVWRPAGDLQNVGIHVTEPLLVKAFRRRFINRWRATVESNGFYDRVATVNWLKRQLAQIGEHTKSDVSATPHPEIAASIDQAISAR